MLQMIRIPMAVIAVIAGLVLCSPALAIQGDCNGTGGVDADDMVYLITYLFQDGPQPLSMAECDCDGFPGINLGDLLQIDGFLFQGCNTYASPGTDLMVPSDVRIWVIGRPDAVEVFSAKILVETSVTVDNFVLPFSYAPGPGQSDLSCTSVDFTGSVASGALRTIYDADKKFVIHSYGTASIPAGSAGLLCTVHFGLAGASGTKVTILPTTRGPLFPILFTAKCFNGVDGVRVLSPQFMAPPIGDCNCDRAVDIDDAVWIITYIFQNGPEPGDCY
jgi:hypothetical protein